MPAALAHLLRLTRPERAAKRAERVQRTSWSQHVLPSILSVCFECPTENPPAVNRHKQLAADVCRSTLLWYYSFTGAAFHVESRLRRAFFYAPMSSTQSTPRIERNSHRFRLGARLSRVLVTAVTNARNRTAFASGKPLRFRHHRLPNRDTFHFTRRRVHFPAPAARSCGGRIIGIGPKRGNIAVSTDRQTTKENRFIPRPGGRQPRPAGTHAAETGLAPRGRVKKIAKPLPSNGVCSYGGSGVGSCLARPTSVASA